MSAKELRAAASDVAGACDDEFLKVEGYWTVPDRMMIAKSQSIAAHILATVREDDDEPIDEAWLRSQSRTDGLLLTMMTFVRRLDGYHLEVNGHESANPTTRGEFRALCRCLGVTLKEGT